MHQLDFGQTLPLAVGIWLLAFGIWHLASLKRGEISCFITAIELRHYASSFSITLFNRHS